MLFCGMAWTSLAGATLFGGTHFSQAAATEEDSVTTAPQGLLVKLFWWFVAAGVVFCLLLVDWFVFVCGTEAPPLLGTMAALLPHPPDWGAMASLLKPISQALSARYFFSPGPEEEQH